MKISEDDIKSLFCECQIFLERVKRKYFYEWFNGIYVWPNGKRELWVAHLSSQIGKEEVDFGGQNMHLKLIILFHYKSIIAIPSFTRILYNTNVHKS